MTSGAWFVLFPRAKVPSKNAVLSVLRKIRDATVKDLGDMEFTVAVGRLSFDIALNTSSYVVIETREAVERNRGSLDRADVVATYDTRFELLFDHRDMGDLFNPILSAAERLAKLTSGVVFESNNGVFQ